MIADRYKVEREIGRGGMATVYLCTDNQGGENVAVKLLRPELGSAVVKERFLREIAFASELDHPQIPKVLGSGILDGVPFYVMTYIDGESLRARLDREKQLPIDEAIRIAQEIARPTAYAHSRGIIHRDIKPANVLLSNDSVYVLDFGVARAIMASADAGLTSTGMVVGTPAYMSPEQALAESTLDARSDVYSLGCVIYEMIAGIPPFVGATAQAVMSRRFISPPPPLHESRDALSPEVEAAVMKALARAPADRWQRVDEFASALGSVDRTPTSARQPAVVAPRRMSRRMLLVAAVVASAGVAAYAMISPRNKVETARRAIAEWNFAKAETELRAAVKERPDDPAAQLWLGQTLMLREAPRAEWGPYILRASDRKNDLDAADRARATALATIAMTDAPDCSGLAQLARSVDGEESDFTGVLSYADCMRRDLVVVPDPQSPSHYRFRQSYQAIEDLYSGLTLRNTGKPAAYREIFPRMEQVLVVSKHKLRKGTLRGGETEFTAWPAIDNDTLAYVPYPIATFGAITRVGAPSLDDVLARNLERLSALSAEWVRAAPGDPAAHESRARVLEASGKLDGANNSALADILLARRANRQSHETVNDKYVRDIRAGTTHVRILVKLQRFPAARVVADSILGVPALVALGDSAQDDVDAMLISLAALTGHPRRIIDIESRHASDYPVRLGSGAVRVLPPEVGADALKIGTYSAFGTPRDSITAIAARITTKLEALFPQSEVDNVRTSILRRPLSLAAPAIGPRPAAELGQSRDPFTEALRALARNDRQSALRLSDSIDVLHSGNAPSEITMDVVLEDAWLKSALGDVTRAIAMLDRALNGLSKAPSKLVGSSGGELPAALVRAMLLRAALAEQRGDNAAAARWSQAVRTLWSGGDPEIQAILRPSPR
jgi:predicted Ser/Thr protein kinase